MEIILEIIVPVFGIVGIGYAAARLGVFRQEANKGLSAFVFDFAIPAMLFRTMATTALPAEIEWAYLISYFGGGYGAWLIGSLLSHFVFRRGGAEPAIAGMTGGFSNTVMLGVPLVLTALGDQATLPLFLIIACHSWQLLSVVTVQAEAGIGAREDMRRLPVNVIKGLVRNPIIIALLAGVLWNLAGLQLPPVVDTLTGTLGRAALPCAVFAMGASLAGYRLAGSIGEAGIGVALKLALHPVLVWLLATHVFAVDPLWRDVAVILASLPVGINVYLMAQRYQAGIAPTVTAILISTGLSVLTVAGVLTLLEVR
ncbi:MAG: AEC family transporter [Thalassobaculum sp.]|uniref:AEC family transporter n=1 Tax=Thalassobaculum sp. TaxID=2022740 RepID=UPI0032EB5BA5